MRLLRTLALIVVLAVSAVSAVSSFGAGIPTAAPSSFVYDDGQYRYDVPEQVDETPARSHSGRIYADDAVNPSRAVRIAARPVLAAKAGTSVAKYDADFALSQLTRSGSGKASELIDFATRQGWTRSQTATGPIKFVDNKGVTRLTIKSGSPRAPGSNFPHVEVRNAAGQRVDPYGNAVTRRSPGNHTPIEWDLP